LKYLDAVKTLLAFGTKTEGYFFCLKAPPLQQLSFCMISTDHY